MPDISSLFEEPSDNPVEDQLGAVRNLLRDYQRGRELENQGRKAAKEAKDAIEHAFSQLPDEVKTVVNDRPTTIAGQTFARTRKTIELDGWLIVMKQRVDTTFDRKTVSTILEREVRNHSSGDAIIARRVVDAIKQRIDRTMNPHITDVIVVERKKGTRSSSRARR